jgi:hypothetical protein
MAKPPACSSRLRAQHGVSLKRAHRYPSYDSSSAACNGSRNAAHPAWIDAREGKTEKKIEAARIRCQVWIQKHTHVQSFSAYIWTHAPALSSPWIEAFRHEICCSRQPSAFKCTRLIACRHPSASVDLHPGFLSSWDCSTRGAETIARAPSLKDALDSEAARPNCTGVSLHWSYVCVGMPILR